MLEHLVLIRWKEGVDRQSQDAVLRSLLALRDKIPGIVKYELGHNVSERAQGYHAAIASTFVDAAALAAYGPHPEHQRVSAKLRDLSDSILVVDFAPLPA